jgi:hypothetical protein
MRRETVVIERGGRRMRFAVIPSGRRDMHAAEYTQHALAEAGAWGSACEFWLRDGDEARVRRLAKLAARWAMKVVDAK